MPQNLVPRSQLARFIIDNELDAVVKDLIPVGEENAIIRENLIQLLYKRGIHYSPAKLTRRLNALGYKVVRRRYQRSRGLVSPDSFIAYHQ